MAMLQSMGTQGLDGLNVKTRFREDTTLLRLSIVVWRATHLKSRFSSCAQHKTAPGCGWFQRCYRREESDRLAIQKLEEGTVKGEQPLDSKGAGSGMVHSYVVTSSRSQLKRLGHLSVSSKHLHSPLALGTRKNRCVRECNWLWFIPLDIYSPS
jgi:hypothetical protein